VIFADVSLAGGYYDAAGLTISGYPGCDLHFATHPDSNQAVGNAVGGRRFFSRLVHVPTPLANFHVMAGWGGFGVASPAKHLDVFQAGIRKATALDIATGVALPELQAFVSQRSAALATLEGQYATLNQAVGTQGVKVEQNLQAISQHAGDLATLFGRWGVSVDVLGRIIGIALNNNGATGIIDILADVFRISDPDGNSGFTLIDGVVRIVTGARRLTLGGGSNFVLWSGSTGVATGAESIANSDFALGTDGKIYTGGSELNGANTAHTGGWSAPTNNGGSSGSAVVRVIPHTGRATVTLTGFVSWPQMTGSTTVTMQVQYSPSGDGNWFNVGPARQFVANGQNPDTYVNISETRNGVPNGVMAFFRVFITTSATGPGTTGGGTITVVSN
jgi:hypothetical protein